MSNLSLDHADHAAAAGKHVLDAEALLAAGRHDGAAYLAGYGVECSLKAVIVHDRAFDAASGTCPRAKLEAAHAAVKKLGHKLALLATETLSPAGLRYLPSVLPLTVVSWQETRRYAAPGFVAGLHASIGDEARAFTASARAVYDESVKRMLLDGVL